jgi:dipeptidyl aminopeptidase/acylaminoacyl peptidase
LNSPTRFISKRAVFPKYKKLNAYEITYWSQELKVKGLLMLPKLESSVFPGLMYCRGGIRQVGMVKPERIASFAERGYAVFAPYYRGNEGGDGREDFAGEDRYDVYHGLELMSELPMIRQGPIPIIGFSRGAMMALLAARDCSLAGPVTVWGGVSDLFYTYEERVDLRRMLKRVVGHPMKQQEAYISRSPIHWMEQVEQPLLIVHGTEDELVSSTHAKRLAAACDRIGKPYQLRLLQGFKHHLPREIDEQVVEAILQWIEQQSSGILN